MFLPYVLIFCAIFGFSCAIHPICEGSKKRALQMCTKKHVCNAKPSFKWMCETHDGQAWCCKKGKSKRYEPIKEDPISKGQSEETSADVEGVPPPDTLMCNHPHVIRYMRYTLCKNGECSLHKPYLNEHWSCETYRAHDYCCPASPPGFPKTNGTSKWCKYPHKVAMEAKHESTKPGAFKKWFSKSKEQGAKKLKRILGTKFGRKNSTKGSSSPPSSSKSEHSIESVTGRNPKKPTATSGKRTKSPSDSDEDVPSETEKSKTGTEKSSSNSESSHPKNSPPCAPLIAIKKPINVPLGGGGPRGAQPTHETSSRAIIPASGIAGQPKEAPIPILMHNHPHAQPSASNYDAYPSGWFTSVNNGPIGGDGSNLNPFRYPDNEDAWRAVATNVTNGGHPPPPGEFIYIDKSNDCGDKSDCSVM